LFSEWLFTIVARAHIPGNYRRVRITFKEYHAQPPSVICDPADCPEGQWDACLAGRCGGTEMAAELRLVTCARASRKTTSG
jgi:hypothetical protein